MRNLTLRDPSFMGASLFSVTNTPLFNFSFSGNRTLTDTVSGGSLITFSRAEATATFANSSGILQVAAANAARFDTNPATLESLGLLVEDQRQNLLFQSENFTTTWQRTNIRPFGSGSVADAITAPDGNTTADLLVETADASALVHNASQNVAITSGQQYSYTVFTKPSPSGSSRRLQLFFSLGAVFSSTPSAVFVPSTGAIATVSAGAVATIISYPNGWYRCLLLTPAAIATGSTSANIRFDNGTTSAYIGDGSSGLYLWGAMPGPGIPSSYVPTGASTATRNADLADITNANAALIAAIRTIFVEFRSPAIGTRGVLSLNDGTANNRIDIQTSGTAVQVLIVTGGTTITIAAGTITANARIRLAVRIGDASSSASLNGAAPVTAAATRPTVDRAGIGRTQAGDYLVGTIATITAWGQEFSDSMLIYQST